MNQNSTKSGLFKKISIGLGLALAVSTVGISGSNAKSVPQAKRSGKDIIILIGEKDANWCSQSSPGGGQIGASGSVLESLTIMNNKGDIVPYLAESVTPSNGNMTWTVKVRAGIKYTDGEALNADNLINNFRALAGIGGFFKGGPTADLPAIAWQQTFNVPGLANLKLIGKQIAAGGLKALATSKEYGMLVVNEKKAFVKIDDLTVQLNLAVPRPNLDYNLWANGRTRMMSSASLASKTCGTTTAVGTGPFMIKSKGTDPFVTELVKNPNYWRLDKNSNKLPYADTVTFKTVLDGGQRVNAMAKGQADIALFGATSGQQLNRVKDSLKDKVTLYEGPRDTNWAFHFNTMKAPFNNLLAREAFAYALDRETFAKISCKGNCEGAIAMAPKMHPYFSKKGAITFDLKKAKAKVAEYKAATGKALEFQMPISDTVESTNDANLVCSFMKAAGIGCTLMAPVTPSAYISRAFEFGQQVTWFNVMAGKYAEFANLFSTTSDLELSGYRLPAAYGGVGDGQLAACFDKAWETSSPANNTLKACAEELQSKSYWTGVYTEGLFAAVSKKVTGFGETILPNGNKRAGLIAGNFDVASVIGS
ncbi:MAG: ABC transporter substrate-binding protein [Actinobacteria bacterium]|nr:ABC transporter substrate-binding protein [Actinomycetota bacterium]